MKHGIIGSALAGLACGCTAVPSPTDYQKAGDGFAYCKSLVDAGARASALGTAGFGLAVALGVAVTVVVAIVTYRETGATATPRWLRAACAGSSIWLSLFAGLATYLRTCATDGDAAGLEAQKLIAQIPPRDDKNSATDYPAWQGCNEAAAIWRGSHREAMQQAANQLNELRKEQTKLAQSAGDAESQVQAAETKTTSLVTEATEAKTSVKAAQVLVARARETAARSRAAPVAEELQKTEAELDAIQQRVSKIEAAGQSVRADTATASAKLKQSTKTVTNPR